MAGTSSGVMIAASAWAEPEMPETTSRGELADVGHAAAQVARRAAAAKLIRRADMPLALRTSAVTRNIRITSSSSPPVRPIVDWVVLKGTRGSGVG